MQKKELHSGQKEGMIVDEDGATALHWQRGARLNSGGIRAGGPE